jgi:hypothetical protein
LLDKESSSIDNDYLSAVKNGTYMKVPNGKDSSSEGHDKGKYTTGETPKAYSYEATKIELLAGQHGDVSSTSPRNSNNSISVVNLLNGVEKSYEKGKKLLDSSKVVDENGEPIIVLTQIHLTQVFFRIHLTQVSQEPLVHRRKLRQF